MKDLKMLPKVVLVVALVIACSPSVTATRLDRGGKPATVGKVVDFLQKLLQKSTAEGEAEQQIYGKFKCYCDDNEKSKSAEVKEQTEGISKLESELEGLQSATGELSTQCAKLKTDLADNTASQDEAKSIRSKANKDFKAETADFKKAIGQMSDAIAMLGAVGADQTQSSGADHAKFMAGYKKKSASFLGLNADVRNAMVAASALLPSEQRSKVDSFIQAPFTGSYSSQSAGVMGILKSMKDTFESNLQSAADAESDDAKANSKLMANLEGQEKEMTKVYGDKQQELGENDSELAAKKLQLKSAKSSKESANDFLDQLLPMCEKKGKEYEARTMLRKQEEASIAEAVSLLNSDSAFKTFAQADDAETFMQLRVRRRAGISHIRTTAAGILAKAAAENDKRLSTIVALVQGSNPFSVVIKEIEKMEALITKEQGTDEEKKAYCTKETDGNTNKLKATNDDIDKIEEAVEKLDESVNKPLTGLKGQEDALEKAMLENVDNQKKETTMRSQENMQYQKNVAQLVQAEELLAKAVKVLKKFYSGLDDKSGVEAASLLQEDPTPPSTWDGAYEGQSDSAEGNNGAIGMINFILDETKKQNTQAHKEESDAQQEYEDSMEKLTKEQKDQQKNMIGLKQAMAKAELEMVDKNQDLKQAKKDKKATENLLADIKPGCDFIFDNFDLRTTNRGKETKALVQAKTLIKKSPAYQAASAEAEADALGDCQSKCSDPNHVKCKACISKVSIPGYCAGHAGTPGC